MQRVSIVDDAEKVMEVIVEDKQLSLAIGKKGQNVRLAAKLTGWKIDIKSEEEKRREVEAQLGALEIGEPGGRRDRAGRAEERREPAATEDAAPQATAADDEAQAVAGGDDAQADDVTEAAGRTAGRRRAVIVTRSCQAPG